MKHLALTVLAGFLAVSCTTKTDQVAESTPAKGKGQPSAEAQKFNVQQMPTVIVTDRMAGATAPGRARADGAYEWDPTLGTVSQGDLWRVKNGNPAAPAIWVTPSNIEQYNTESYTRLDDNPFRAVASAPLSTFSVDVDTASYANVRRFLRDGQLPPRDAVRIEEMVNYFSYDYAPPRNGDPFSVDAQVAECPWELEHRLVRIGVQGKEIPLDDRPPSNLVFLIDVSGSMNQARKLPLLKQSLGMLVDQLSARDTVSIVVYAGSAGEVLPPTSGADKAAILGSLDNLRAGGSTNGGEGIQLAYKRARENFLPGGINRVMLCTDGDFNVGTSDTGSLTRLVEEKAKDGVFLSVLGFGGGNLNDAMMEEITNRGNGNYAYIDTRSEAKKVLVEQMSGTLLTIAKDVKIQVEFNPAQVKAYRLVGYTNRLMANEDFNDDTKDAGDIGAGHSVTAFYEVVPSGVEMELPETDELKYQKTVASAEGSKEMLTVKLRYKQPDGDTSRLIEMPVVDSGQRLVDAPDDFVFAASVASFGMLLQESEYQGLLTLESVSELAESSSGAVGSDKRRTEFVDLVRRASDLRQAAR